jgi:hypothetical protein
VNSGFEGDCGGIVARDERGGCAWGCVVLHTEVYRVLNYR